MRLASPSFPAREGTHAARESPAVLLLSTALIESSNYAVQTETPLSGTNEVGGPPWAAGSGVSGPGSGTHYGALVPTLPVHPRPHRHSRRLQARGAPQAVASVDLLYGQSSSTGGTSPVWPEPHQQEGINKYG